MAAAADQLFPDDLIAGAARLIDMLRARPATIAFAESCTGGLLSALLTSIPGSSDVLGFGFVSYSNEAKTELLGVPEPLLNRYGAVSPQVAGAMATGALERSGSSLALAVTGIAGPSGGSALKPVGLVYIAISRSRTETKTHELQLGDIGRASIRLKTVEAALKLAIDACAAL